VPPADYLPYDVRFGSVPPFAPFGSGYRYNVTGLTHDRAGFPTMKANEVAELLDRMHRKIEDNLEDVVRVREYNASGCDRLLVACGAAVNSCIGAMEIAAERSLSLGVLQLVTVWPFAERQVAEAARGKEKVFVVEMNRGQLVHEVRRAACGGAEVLGIHKYDGTLITPRDIIEAAAR